MSVSRLPSAALPSVAEAVDAFLSHGQATGRLSPRTVEQYQRTFQDTTAQAVRPALEQAETDVEALRGQRQQLAQRLAAVDGTVELLDQAASRLGDLATSLETEHRRSEKGKAPSPGPDEPRTQAVVRILEEDGPLSAAGVTEKLQARGGRIADSRSAQRSAPWPERNGPPTTPPQARAYEFRGLPGR